MRVLCMRSYLKGEEKLHRVLHRNLLLPCDSLPQENSEATVQPETMTMTKTKTRRKDRKCLEEVQSDVSFQRMRIFRMVSWCYSCQNPAHLNPEAEPFTPSVEQCWDRQSPRIEEERTEGAPEEQIEEDPGMPAGQSEESEGQASVESEDDDSIPVNSYPRRDRHRTTLPHTGKCYISTCTCIDTALTICKNKVTRLMF